MSDLFYVRPALTGNDRIDRTLAAESIDDRKLARASTKGRKAPDFTDVIFADPSVPAMPREAALGGTIKHVLRMGAGKEMVGANAARIVAAVANLSTVRDGAEVQLPRHSMRRAALPIDGNFPVAAAHESSRPLPAAVGFSDLGPKAMLQRVNLPQRLAGVALVQVRGTQTVGVMLSSAARERTNSHRGTIITSDNVTKGP